MHPQVNPANRDMDADLEERLERARRSIKEMSQIVQILIDDLRNGSGDSMEVPLAISELILRVQGEYEDALAEEQLLNQELEDLQEQ